MTPLPCFAAFLTLFVVGIHGCWYVNTTIKKTEAICFKNYYSLEHQISRLEKTVKRLTIKHCYFDKDTIRANLLEKFVDLEYFNVTMGYLKHIEPGAFSKLPKLKGLDFTENFLEMKELENALNSLNVTRLKHLYFRSNKFYDTPSMKEVPTSLLKAFDGLEIDVLDLMNNYIGKAAHHFFTNLQYLSKVKCIFVGYNRFKIKYLDFKDFMDNIHRLLSLVMIDFSYQKIIPGIFDFRVQQHGYEMRSMCESTLNNMSSNAVLSSLPGQVNYPQNLSIVIGRQSVPDLLGKNPARTYVAPSNIKHIDLTGCSIIDCDFANLSLSAFSELEVLHFGGTCPSDNNPLKFDVNTFSGLHKLKTLVMANNHIEKSSSSVGNAFANTTNLITLHAQNIPSVTTLQANGPGSFLSAQSVQNLNVSNSYISKYPSYDFFEKMKNLKTLDLSSHMITTVTPSEFYLPPSVKIYLNGKEDFQCHCISEKEKNLKEWLAEQSNQIVDYDLLKCVTKEDGEVSLKEFNKKCQEDFNPLIVLGIVLGILATIGIVLGIHYFRWHLIFLYYKLIRKRMHSVNLQKADGRVFLLQAESQSYLLDEVRVQLAQKSIPVMDPYNGLVTGLKNGRPIYSDQEAVLGMDLGDCIFRGLDNAQLIVLLLSNTAVGDRDFQFGLNIAKVILERREHVEVLFVHSTDDILSEYEGKICPLFCCCWGDSNEDKDENLQSAQTRLMVDEVKRLREPRELYLSERAVPGDEKSPEHITETITSMLQTEILNNVKSSAFSCCRR